MSRLITENCRTDRSDLAPSSAASLSIIRCTRYPFPSTAGPDHGFMHSVNWFSDAGLLCTPLEPEHDRVMICRNAPVAVHANRALCRPWFCRRQSLEPVGRLVERRLRTPEGRLSAGPAHIVVIAISKSDEASISRPAAHGIASRSPCHPGARLNSAPLHEQSSLTGVGRNRFPTARINVWVRDSRLRTFFNMFSTLPGADRTIGRSARLIGRTSSLCKALSSLLGWLVIVTILNRRPWSPCVMTGRPLADPMFASRHARVQCDPKITSCLTVSFSISN